jgi:AcrR family transcriptional regulator
MPRPRLEDARSRILVAALGLFAANGCERVNSNAIARAAGLGIGTFYLHFANKYAVLRELQLRTLEGLREARAQALLALEGADSPLDEAARVRAPIAGAVDFARDHPEAYRVCFGRERAAVAHAGPVLSESARPIARVLQERQARGLLAPELDPELAARAYLAMEAGLLLWWLEDPRRATAASVVETLFRLHPARPADRPGSRSPA